MPLTDQDQHHLTAAEGYVELGMWLDANAELDEIDPEARHLPEVLKVRLSIYQGLKKWGLAQVVAVRLSDDEPENERWPAAHAMAARRVEGLESAKAILLAAVERLPRAAVLQYNLACYECQLGELAIARARLASAFRANPKLRIVSIDDNDLKPLWDWLGSDPGQIGFGPT
jgi:hypothetical protein